MTTTMQLKPVVNERCYGRTPVFYQEFAGFSYSNYLYTVFIRIGAPGMKTKFRGVPYLEI